MRKLPQNVWCLRFVAVSRSNPRWHATERTSERVWLLCPDKISFESSGNIPWLLAGALERGFLSLRLKFFKKPQIFHGEGPRLRPVCSWPTCPIWRDFRDAMTFLPCKDHINAHAVIANIIPYMSTKHKSSCKNRRPMVGPSVLNRWLLWVNQPHPTPCCKKCISADVAVVAIFIVLMNAVSTYRLTSNDNAVLSMVFQMVGIKDPIISQMLWTHYTTLHDFPL